MAAPTDPYALLQYNMIHAHDTYKLGYDTILSLLDNPPMDDLKNFLGYCEAWADSIELHHNSEENVVFPLLKEKIDFSKQISQHEGIHATLDEVLAMINAARADPSKFDVAKLKNLMQGFRGPLYEHLDEEVEYIGPEHLKVFEVDHILYTISELVKYAKSHGDPFLSLPYMRSHTPPEFKDTWPPLPWVLRKILIPYVFAMRYSGYWKYSPYATS